MSRREGNKNTIITNLSKEVASVIRRMKDGEESTIGRIVFQILKACGYESMHLGLTIGHAWTKDGGKTYILKDMDLFSVLDTVQNMLEGEISLAFSKYEDKIVGLPYNFEFTVRKAAN